MAGLTRASKRVIVGITGLPVTTCVKVSKLLVLPVPKRATSVVFYLFSAWENEKYHRKSTKWPRKAPLDLPTYPMMRVRASKKDLRRG